MSNTTPQSCSSCQLVLFERREEQEGKYPVESDSDDDRELFEIPDEEDGFDAWEEGDDPNIINEDDVFEPDEDEYGEEYPEEEEF